MRATWNKSSNGSPESANRRAARVASHDVCSAISSRSSLSRPIEYRSNAANNHSSYAAVSSKCEAISGVVGMCHCRPDVCLVVDQVDAVRCAHSREHSATKGEIGMFCVERLDGGVSPYHESVILDSELDFDEPARAVLDQRQQNLADGDPDVVDLVDRVAGHRRDTACGEPQYTRQRGIRRQSDYDGAEHRRVMHDCSRS